jgi:hypothetical protein
MKISKGRVVELVVVGLLLVGTAWLGRLVQHNYVVHPSAVASSGIAVAPMAVPARLATGAEAALAVRAVSQAQVLLVVSTDCPYCEQNMPEWKRLAATFDALGANGPRPVILSVSGAEETATYLQRHGLEAEVRLVDRAVLPVTGYPATVAVDPSTGAISAWTGVLSEGDHQAVAAWAEARQGAGS